MKRHLRFFWSCLFSVFFASAEYELPYDMRELRDYELHQLGSCLQEGFSCAWYATLNAFAIQELYAKRAPITEQAIQEHVAQKGIPLIRIYGDQLKTLLGEPIFNGLSAPQQQELAQFLGLTNYYVVVLREDGTISCMSDKQASYESVEQLLKTMKYDPTPLIHILLVVPSETSYHAVLISRLKRRAPKPFLFYLDSNNISLNHWSWELVKEPHLAGLFTRSYWVPYRTCSSEYQARNYVCGFIKQLDQL